MPISRKLRDLLTVAFCDKHLSKELADALDAASISSKLKVLRVSIDIEALRALPANDPYTDQLNPIKYVLHTFDKNVMPIGPAFFHLIESWTAAEGTNNVNCGTTGVGFTGATDFFTGYAKNNGSDNVLVTLGGVDDYWNTDMLNSAFRVITSGTQLILDCDGSQNGPASGKAEVIIPYIEL